MKRPAPYAKNNGFYILSADAILERARHTDAEPITGFSFQGDKKCGT